MKRNTSIPRLTMPKMIAPTITNGRTTDATTSAPRTRVLIVTILNATSPMATKLKTMGNRIANPPGGTSTVAEPHALGDGRRRLLPRTHNLHDRRRDQDRQHSLRRLGQRSDKQEEEHERPKTCGKHRPEAEALRP